MSAFFYLLTSVCNLRKKKLFFFFKCDPLGRRGPAGPIGPMGRAPDSASPGPPGDQGLPGLDGIRGIKTKTTSFYHVKKTLRLLGKQGYCL